MWNAEMSSVESVEAMERSGIMVNHGIMYNVS